MTLPPASSNSLPARQTGSYLLEALIAILIFAFGVLGLVGLLGTSLRVTNDARYRAEAANLANGMIADMWTMTAANIDAEFAPGGAKLTAWTTKIASLLPQATGANAPVVVVTPGISSESRTVVVTVYWQLPGDPLQHQQVMTAQIGKNPT
jgi:type IV pilus assembly protein PilV